MQQIKKIISSFSLKLFQYSRTSSTDERGVSLLLLLIYISDSFFESSSLRSIRLYQISSQSESISTFQRVIEGNRRSR